MKNLTKTIAAASIAVASLFSANVVKAQSATPANAWRFGIGIEGMAPTGNLHNISNAGLGGTARLQYGINNNLALTITSGYYNFFGKENTYEIPSGTTVTRVTQKNVDFGIVPVKAGLKAYIGDGFYVAGEVGAGFETKDAYRGRTGDYNEKATKLILAPGVGYSWSNVDLGVRYENFSGNNNNYGMVAARLAYGFKL
ncbi:outer membrane beta-barrel protein [Mucilaginibacter galii]|uniref:Outer membrane protein beta-barrel domain-containing protein n=1 Tax=Mucilaginibacter galii TaxID=2005073 RepID=A0A917J5A3_9SPHI|nr:outer membrane beta-barrel protein [Mucilaginibacter galii]GGI48939.1 hypothetical protein GCM10011425_01510 [Mucilaginibacter galii]